MQVRQRYTKEFKLEAVRQLEEENDILKRPQSTLRESCGEVRLCTDSDSLSSDHFALPCVKGESVRLLPLAAESTQPARTD